MQRATGQAKKAAAKHLDVPADALTLDPIDDKSVPGVVVFRAVWSQGSRTAHVGGVVVGGEVELDGARAMGRVYQAWGYGPTRTRSAEEVARVAVNPQRSLMAGARGGAWGRRARGRLLGRRSRREVLGARRLQPGDRVGRVARRQPRRPGGVHPRPHPRRG
ncbi:MAG: hypothetical protein IPO67_21360 [Deltaproteobacteria bacterium]|nr:hypothetical protein [Deltaproteobacteria bacterium]